MAKQQLYGLGSGLISLTEASSTEAGIVELATVAETVAGTDNFKAVTPLGVAAVAIQGAPDASTGQKGIVELATSGEAIAKVNSTNALTPNLIPFFMASPGPIGTTTPDAGAFTSLTASGAFSLTGDVVQVSEGGTGVGSLTDHAVLLGSGVGAVTPMAVGAVNQVIIGQTNADPIWSNNLDLPGTLDVTGVATFDNDVSIAGTTTFNGTINLNGDFSVDSPTFFVSATNHNVGIGTITPTVTDKLHIVGTAAATALITEIENTNANAASDAELLVKVSGGTGGDPKVVLSIPAATSYSIGVDNSASDNLCISTGTAPGTNDNIRITSAGAISANRGDITITRDAGAGSSLGLNVTNTNAADLTSNAVVNVTSGNVNSGDAQVNLAITGGSSYHIGIDNSDNDYLKIGLGTAVGTTDYVRVTTSGAVSVLAGNLDTTRSQTGTVSNTISNTSVGAGTDNAAVLVSSGGAAGGDALSTFSITGATDWSIGVDNSATDAFVICDSTTLGTNNRFTIQKTSGIVNIPGSLTIGTPLAVDQGGTGVATLTSHGVVVGNATSAVTATAEGSNGQVLLGKTGDVPAFGTLTTDTQNSLTYTTGPNALKIALSTNYLVEDTITVTTGELLALRATPKTLVAAPAAGSLIEFVSAMLIYDYNSTPYTITNAGDDMAIRYTNTVGPICSQTIETTGFLDQAADTITNALPKINLLAAAGVSVAEPLLLHNIGAAEWTNGNSPVIVKISYRVHVTGL